MQVITLASRKGGTGKTTTAAVLAQAAAYRGRRCLAIDLDPQCNLSFFLGARTDGPGSFELISGEDPGRLLQKTPAGVDAIPASWNLAAVTSSTGSARRLQRALQNIRLKYDLIIIDTPTAGELQYNALQAATGLLIPLQADVYGIKGFFQIIDTARQIMTTNPALKALGVILTQYDRRSNLARQMQESIKASAHAAGVPYLGEIRKAVAVQEAAALQQSLFKYAPNSKPAQDYLALFDALKL